jgi:hypothetical protein
VNAALQGCALEAYCSADGTLPVASAYCFKNLSCEASLSFFLPLSQSIRACSAACVIKVLFINVPSSIWS